MDTEKQRQRRRNIDAGQEQRHQKGAATRDAYRVAINQPRMAARRALEWIGMSNAWLVFRYEYQTFCVHKLTQNYHSISATHVCTRGRKEDTEVISLEGT